MEPDRLYDDVITRFLLNEAGPEEEAFVREWMKADEKNRLYVEALEKTLQLVSIRQNNNKINLEDEWEQLQHAVAEKQNLAGFTDDQASTGRRGRIMKLIIGTAVAASLILAIGIGSGWFSDRPSQGTASNQKTKTTTTQPGKIDSLMAVVQHEVNTSGKTKQLILPDGSKIVLSDSSELTYKEPAEGNRREVYLSGKAEFKVAKNKTKPFTVFSDAISTTAVGTKFTVTTREKERFIRVRLQGGKVVVRLLKGYTTNWPKEIYLVPGQELVYDKSRREVSVESFMTGSRADSQSLSQPTESPAIPHYDKRSWFMFNNQPLNEIFDALAEMYDRKIMYQRKDVKNMYFIGTYDKTDSLEKILKQIALLNNLTLTKQNDTFKIEKKTVRK